MSPVSIRQCQPGDEAALSLVGQATFLEAYAGVISGKDILGHCAKQHAVEKYTAWLNDLTATIWMAEIDPGQAPIGYLVLTAPDLPLADLSASDVEVKRVYVLHRLQRTGLGVRLMDTARDHAKAKGFRRLLLGVYSLNTAAIKFYEKLGYRKVGERSFKVGDSTYHDFVLGLPLV